MARDDALDIDDMGYVVGTSAFEKCFRLETVLIMIVLYLGSRQ